VAIEEAAARMGIDLAPREGEHRDHPEPAEAKAYQANSFREYVDKELGSSEGRVGAPSEAVTAWLTDHETQIERVRSAALGKGTVEWETDVSGAFDAPLPNVLGHVRLQVVLAAYALDQVRRADWYEALQTAEAMWRLCESLASRPELISQMMVLNEARLVVGLLRKIDAPALEWTDRLRGRAFFLAFLATFQNEPWHFPADPEMAPIHDGMARIYRRFAEGLAERSPCAWSREALEHSWDVAVSGEDATEQVLAGISSDNIQELLRRWHRYLLDAELTALVLEARGEKAASRDGLWPAKLPNLESEVCPGQFYSYKRSGGVTLGYDGRPPAIPERGLILPLTFRGAAPPTPRPTVTPASPPGPTPTPTPTHP
jgi:hypothetical protein